MANRTASKRKATEVVDDSSDDSLKPEAPPESQPAAESQRPPRESKTKLYNNPTWDRKSTPTSRGKPPAKKIKPSSKNDAGLEAPAALQSRLRRPKEAVIDNESDEDMGITQQTGSDAVAFPLSQPRNDVDLFEDNIAFEIQGDEAADAEYKRDAEADSPESEDGATLNMNEKELEAQFESERGAWSHVSSQQPQSVSQSPITTRLSTPNTTMDGITTPEDLETIGTTIIDDLDSDDENMALPSKPAPSRKGKGIAPSPSASVDYDELDSEIMEASKRVEQLKNAKIARMNRSGLALPTTPMLPIKMKAVPRPNSKPKAGVRQLKHELEQAKWAPSTLPQSSGSQPFGRPAARPLIIKPEHVEFQIPQFAQWTDLRYHSGEHGQSTFLLNSQEPRVRETVKQSFIFLWGFYCWTNAYPGIGQNIEFIRKSLLKAAKYLNYSELSTRLSSDVEYSAALSVLVNSIASKSLFLPISSDFQPNARVSSWRSNAKKDASSSVVNSYQLTRTNPRRTVGWLAELAYIYPGDVGDVANNTGQTLDGGRPYEHPVILTVLEQCFFTGPSSIGARLINKFKSSRKDRPEEKEVPIPMLALIATGVYAATKEWETGSRIKTEFGGKLFEMTYQRHVEFLDTILAEKPNAFHAMMHRIYLRVSGAALLPSDEPAPPISSILKMDMMVDD
ncbi:hypothetical protein BD779DRAFT_1676926 [Infundibulicybe gibba]|nr:hypothetical protein BD779DRAFT_1676926 [Infundibulicybe gibba]